MNQPSIYEIMQLVRRNTENKRFKDLEDARKHICEAFDIMWLEIEHHQNVEQAKEEIIQLISELVKILWNLDELM